MGQGKPGLGDLLRDLKDETGRPINKLTVLSKGTDPFRLDTPAYHVYGRWFRDMMERCGLLGRERPIHLRGIHYAIVSLPAAERVLPSGKPYLNNEACWTFLQECASKAGRWLGYVSFEQLTDARNEQPTVRLRAVERAVETASPDEFPQRNDLTPRVAITDISVPQRYRLVIFGEKTSLAEVLEPISVRFGTDLYLPSGEISDTFLAKMARTGAEDGREMIVLVLADCDPAGYQMAVSIGHKLRAFKESLYPDLRFRLFPVALTVEQVARLALPSTPLKESEKRADGWRARYGVEQTEIDALATLQPNVLTEIVEEAIAPFFDDTLAERVDEAVEAWRDEAQAAFERAAAETNVDELLATAEERRSLAAEALNDLAVAIADVEFPWPELNLPEPEVDEYDQPEGLVDSEMELIDHIEQLRERKDYAGNGADDDKEGGRPCP